MAHQGLDSDGSRHVPRERLRLCPVPLLASRRGELRGRGCDAGAGIDQRPVRRRVGIQGAQWWLAVLHRSGRRESSPCALGVSGGSTSRHSRTSMTAYRQPNIKGYPAAQRIEASMDALG